MLLLFVSLSLFPLMVYAQDDLGATLSLPAGVAIITHPSVKTESFSQQDIKELFTLESNKWQDGSLVVLFEHKQNTTSKKTFYRYIEHEPREIKKIWMRVILSGEGRTPMSINSEEEVLRRVSETPGSIGYIRASLVTDDVQVLMIIDDDTALQGM